MGPWIPVFTGMTNKGVMQSSHFVSARSGSDVAISLNINYSRDCFATLAMTNVYSANVSFCGPLSAFVNLTAMANGENQDNHFLVLYVAQYSVVSNSISPESGSISPQRFSKMPGVFASLDPVV